MGVNMKSTITDFEQCEGDLDMGRLEQQLEMFRDEATSAGEESAWSLMFQIACQMPTVADFVQELRNLDRNNLSEQEMRATVALLYCIDLLQGR